MSMSNMCIDRHEREMAEDEEYAEYVRQSEEDEIKQWQEAAKQYRFQTRTGIGIGSNRSGICSIKEQNNSGVTITSPTLYGNEPIFFHWDEIYLEEMK